MNEILKDFFSEAVTSTGRYVCHLYAFFYNKGQLTSVFSCNAFYFIGLDLNCNFRVLYVEGLKTIKAFFLSEQNSITQG